MSKTLKIVNATGAQVGEYPLNDAWLEYEKGAQAVHDCVVAFLASMRNGTACTKVRSEVRGGGAKPWKQKGTGRARAGSIRSPIFRGGGITFGPRPHLYTKKVNKKVRALALRRAFTERFTAQAVTILDKIPEETLTVKAMKNILNAVNASGTILLVVKEYDETVIRSAFNLPNVLVIKALTTNVYQLLRHSTVLFTKDAMDEFVCRFGKGE